MLSTICWSFCFLLLADLITSQGFPDYYRERITEWRIRKEERHCKDKSWANCAYYRSINYCVSHRKTLRKRCRKSCLLCGNIKTCAFTEYGCCWDMYTPAKGRNDKGCPRNCHNRLGRHKCKLLQLNGACYSDKDRMEQMCRGICVCEKRPARSPSFCASTKYGCCWDGITVADKFNKNCPVCRNFVNSRICRIFSRDCYDYTGIKGWQMRRFCPKTCGICRTYWKRILDRYMGDLSREINVIKDLRRISPLVTPKPT